MCLKIYSLEASKTIFIITESKFKILWAQWLGAIKQISGAIDSFIKFKWADLSFENSIPSLAV